MKLNILTYAESSSQLCIHPHVLESLALREKQTLYLRFGIRSISIHLCGDDSLNQDELKLSQDSIQVLQIPLFCQYELKVDDDVLVIGPYISFLTSNKMKTNERYLQYLTDYLRHYQEIGGAVLAFAVEGIERENSQIKGFVYNPQTDQWVQGTYPFPATVFFRGHVSSREWRNYFKEVIATHAVFNDFYLDKWEMHQLLSTSPVLRTYLPATLLYQQPTELISFLKRFSQAYIKPIHGTMGKSIMKVGLSRSGIGISYHQEQKNRKRFFTQVERAQDFLKFRLKPKQFIIQKALPLLSYQRNLVDFRLIVVKNGQGLWEYMGMIARCAAQDSIVSNVSLGGEAVQGEKILQKAFNLTAAETVKQAERMADLAMDIAHFLDGAGLHCGNMGIDLGMERNGKLWIIEIQHHSPAHSIALDAKNVQMYSQILRNNMLYMSRLAGFAMEEEQH